MLLLTTALQINESARTTPSVAANYLNLGRAYVAFGPLDQAETQLLKALQLFRSIEDVPGLANAHEACARLYALRKDTNRMRFHLDRSREGYAYLKDEAGLRRVESIK